MPKPKHIYPIIDHVLNYQRLKINVFRNFVRPINLTNTTQFKSKLMGSYFNFVRLGCKTCFSLLFGRVAGCHNNCENLNIKTRHLGLFIGLIKGNLEI